MLRIVSIKGVGLLESERVVLKVVEDGNIGSHLLLRPQLGEKGPRAGGAGAFWFHNTNVKAGDTVVLYTKGGERRDRELNGKTTHFYYWGFHKPIWNDVKQDAATLGVFSNWSTFRVSGFDDDEDVEPKAQAEAEE